MMSISTHTIGLCVAVTVALLGVVAVGAVLPTEFERNFDRNLAHDRLAASLAQRDPDLRMLLLARTQAAYDRGGWRAAQAALDIALTTELEVHADDEHVLAVPRATLRVLRALERRPAACKAFLLAGARSDDFSDARLELDELVAAYRAAIQNGFDRKRQGVGWTAPGELAVVADERSLVLRPQALTRAELRAHADYLDGDAASYCGGSIKRLTNLLAKEAPDAARIQRQRTRLTGEIDWVKVFETLCRGHDAPADGLVCSPAVSVDTRP